MFPLTYIVRLIKAEDTTLVAWGGGCGEEWKVRWHSWTGLQFQLLNMNQFQRSVAQNLPTGHGVLRT